ncbi:hypothetical protein BDP67DRAFT_554153 [Colletotrichum lupini]|nr:hypothetical protein BDP67DRAFT_554153 [Colletotrichum lupini]
MIDSSDDKGFDVLELDGSPWLGLKSTGRKVKTAKRRNVPTFPVIFTKPSDVLAGPLDDIKVHPDAQIQLDYEGELVVIIGHDAKDVKEDQALNYVLGYTAGTTNFQLPDASGGQFCYAKSFNGFAPVGPAIWSTESVPDPQKLHLTTIVNGEVVEETGTTLRRGTVIMTGTPSSVGYFRGAFLKDGDLVEVGISGLGRIANWIVF